MKRVDIIRNEQDFQSLYKKGKSAGSKFVVVISKPNNMTYNRKAFIASKKVGNAVVRNRARRIMREAFRETEETLKTGYDLLLIARDSIKDSKTADVKKSIEAAFKRLEIIE